MNAAGAATLWGRLNCREIAAPFGESADERGYFDDLCASGSLEQGYGRTFDQLAADLDTA